MAMKLTKFLKTFTTMCPHGVLGGIEGRRCKTCTRNADLEASRAAGHKKCRHGVIGGVEARRCAICALLSDSQARSAAAFAALSEDQKAKIIQKNEILKIANSTTMAELERLKKIFIPSIDELYQLSGYEFEDFVCGVFERLGYKVKKTPKSNDFGRDAIMHYGGKKYLLECKRYAAENSSGRPDLQKFHSAIISDKAVGGFFVTTGKFTDNAVNFAADKSITLIDRGSLQNFIAKSRGEISDSAGSYNCVCMSCGAVVTANINQSNALQCPNGHKVAPTIRKDEIMRSLVNESNVKNCPKCHSSMKKIKGPYGYFFGCVRYPECDGKLS